MNEQTQQLLEKLSNKLGTTVEHLWGVLVRQAPISSAMDLVVLTAMAIGLAALWRFVKKIHQDANDDYLMPLGILLMVGILGFAAFVCGNLSEIISGFFNPEYWALRQIIHK